MRIAWKIRFAGCPPLRLAGAGIAVLIISTSSPVVSIGCFREHVQFLEQSVSKISLPHNERKFY